MRNALPGPVLLNWRGIDGASALEPFGTGAVLSTGSETRLELPARHAGTFQCELIPIEEPSRLVRPLPVIIYEREPAVQDGEEILLIEEWRLDSSGRAIAPGENAEKSTAFYTVNGKSSFETTARKHDRLRFRFINGSQRTVLAIKLDAVELRVMAIDGQPAEPFPARNGAIVLPPGGRLDAFVDATAASSILLHDGKDARTIGKLSLSTQQPVRNSPRPPAPPLPSNGLPAQIELKGAQRIDLVLGQPNDWVNPTNLGSSSAPAFQAKAGRPVVLALTNRATVATVFHLHGHHFRLLDRLDDGWKPFWLDTLAIEPGQTQRVAFLAEYPGRYLIEQVATDWAAPRLVRWYSVQ
ncbi:multicopper oxidase family protein [Bradyrhizobium sp. CCBAU 51753]|uniref:multicopper oxidase family protein n=1 Tax=Bradyrhizobium sp. CCBAU 51753 TaxID=1325100 RepID=UPI001FEE754F|nr:multicopper oxidase domain-containing protein [Bradyrhizobium sp. CCBAU 51753]